jgi:hypothetical protein
MTTTDADAVRRVLEGDAEALSGDPGRAEQDLEELGERLGLLVRGA